MFKISALALALAFAFSASVFAAEEKKSEGQTTIKIEDTTEKNKVKDGNIDEEVTNARMRAESGSKSKWSLSTSVAYSGGAISRPFGAERPNLAGTPGNEIKSAGKIGLDARYRWSKNHSITLGTQVGMQTPFQGDISAKDTQFNVYDPALGYKLVGKFGDLQTSGGVTYYRGTSQESKGINQTQAVALSVTALKAWQNGLTTGLSLSTAYNDFSDDPGQTKATRSAMYGGDKRVEWSLGLFPFAEYSFNDKYSFRTVFGYFNWKHLYGDNNKYRLLQTYVYQSVGVGISITRDIYLYPNIQFVPDNIRSDFTNVALSATVNVF